MPLPDWWTHSNAHSNAIEPGPIPLTAESVRHAVDMLAEINRAYGDGYMCRYYGQGVDWARESAFTSENTVPKRSGLRMRKIKPMPLPD